MKLRNLSIITVVFIISAQARAQLFGAPIREFFCSNQYLIQNQSNLDDYKAANKPPRPVTHLLVDWGDEAKAISDRYLQHGNGPTGLFKLEGISSRAAGQGIPDRAAAIQYARYIGADHVPCTVGAGVVFGEPGCA